MSVSSHGIEQWGMTVDVDRCTGCKACVTACRAENNIAVVGAEQAAMGRLMDWLRIERIHHGHFPHVHVDFIPMLCQQCGAAPCESVCPVFAAVHTHDGLNGQIYNRCIGTRVCANNCPYHVRMFNFVYPKWPKTMEKVLNPDVSVRNEGIMEKCTFCVQRIRKGELDAKVEGRVHAEGVSKGNAKTYDGEIRPACVQACASEALVFGLLSDPESSVSKTLERHRHRSVLVHNEHDTRPNVIYLRPDRNSAVLEPLERTSADHHGGHGDAGHSDSHVGGEHHEAAPVHAEPTPEVTPEVISTPVEAATPAAAATPN